MDTPPMRQPATRSMTAGLEPYPAPARRPPSQPDRHRTLLGSVLVVGVSVALAAAWVALAVAAYLDYPHAGDDLGSVGGAFAVLLDVVGMITGSLGAACALGGGVAWLLGRRAVSGCLLLASVASPLIASVGFVGFVQLSG